MTNQILGIRLDVDNKSLVLEKIKKYISRPDGFFHIVSLNPEIFVLTEENEEFKKIVQISQIKIIDGIGVYLAAKWLGIMVKERVTGVELMQNLIKMASDLRLRVLLIGGKPNLALRLSKCYAQNYPQAKFLGLEGVSNIKNPQKNEEKAIFSIVSDYKPQIILAAFGSPDQELWFYRHKDKLKGIICLGVGQGFDVYGGEVKQAPLWIRKIGMEWFYRLLTQPWRWKRQIRLIKFIWLVLLQKFNFK